MHQFTDETLTARLARLELENRRWRRTIVMIGFLGFALVVVVGARDDKPENAINTGKITIRDKDEIVRGEFGIRDDGIVGITLNDAKGEKRLDLFAIAEGGAGIRLFNPQGERVMEIYHTPGKEGAGLSIYNYDDNIINLINVGIHSDGEAGLRMAVRNPDGVVEKRAAVVAMPDGSTLLDLRASARKGRVLILSNPDADPGIFRWNADGPIP